MEPSSFTRRCLIVAAAYMFCLPAHAVPALGGEFEVSSDPQAPSPGPAQASPAAGAFPNGTTVVAWLDQAVDGPIVARSYGPGGESLVLTVPLVPRGSDAFDGQIALSASAGGNFVVVWSTRPAEDVPAIHAQWFSGATLKPLGDAIVVEIANGDPSSLRVAADPTGGFAVAWENSSVRANGSVAHRVLTRRFDANGQALTPAAAVRTTSQDLSAPTLAMDAEGNAIVAWQQSAVGATAAKVYGRLYDPSGTPSTAPFLVSGADDAFGPSAAMDVKGDFAIAFTCRTPTLQVAARRYVAGGQSAGGLFAVSPVGTNGASNPVAAMDALGDLVVAWSSYDGSDEGVFAQAYTANGKRRWTPFPVNLDTRQDQLPAAIAMDADGDFTVVWKSHADTIEHAVSDVDVMARRFRGLSNADLAVTMTGTTHVAPGGNLAYRLTVTNVSPESSATGNPYYDGSSHLATGVRLIQDYPEGATFVSIQGEGRAWSCTPTATRLVCDLRMPQFAGTPPAPSLSLKLRAPDAPSGPLLTNAWVSAEQDDLEMGNNLGQVSTRIDAP